MIQKEGRKPLFEFALKRDQPANCRMSHSLTVASCVLIFSNAASSFAKRSNACS